MNRSRGYRENRENSQPERFIRLREKGEKRETPLRESLTFLALNFSSRVKLGDGSLFQQAQVRGENEGGIEVPGVRSAQWTVPYAWWAVDRPSFVGGLATDKTGLFSLAPAKTRGRSAEVILNCDGRFL